MYPVLFKIGPWPVYTYGFLMIAAFFTAFFFVRKKIGTVGLSNKDVSNLFLILFVSGIIGARFFYVVQHAGDFKSRWWAVLMLREGGLVWYGGFITAAAVGALAAYRKRWPLLKLTDLIAPYLALAQGIGRIGCFLNGCCYGKFLDRCGSARYPVQVYEAGVCFLIFFALLNILDRPQRKPGVVFALYLMLYSSARFILEFFRGDQELIARFSIPQWTSLLVCFGGALLYGSIQKKHD